MGRDGQGRIFASEPNVPTRPSASFCGSQDTLRPGPLASSTGKPAPDLAKSWPNVRAQCRTVAWLATSPRAGISFAQAVHESEPLPNVSFDQATREVA